MAEWIAKYWLEFLFGIIATGLLAGYRFLAKRMKKQAEEQGALRNGMKALIRDRIIETYNRCLDRGYCPIYALENLHALHKEYKVLGGNGAMDDILQKAEALPTVPPVLPPGS